MELNDTFAPAVSDWRQSPEAQELLRLRATHGQASRRRADCEAELASLEQGQRAASAAGHPLELGPIAGRLNEARLEHGQAVRAEGQALATADASGAYGKARAALLVRLRVAAAQALLKVGQPSGLPWTAAGQLTEAALAARADQVLANLQPEDA
jgi:hypothetical protein